MYHERSIGDYDGLCFEGDEIVLYLSQSEVLPEYHQYDSTLSDGDVPVTIKRLSDSDYDAYVERCDRFMAYPETRENFHVLLVALDNLVMVSNSGNGGYSTNVMVNEIKRNLLFIR